MTPSTLLRLTAAALLAALAPAATLAQDARAAKAVNMRAGPGRDYPLVVQVGAGTPLAVQGCIDNYSWCDVVVPGPNYRGWVYAGNIAYAYQRAEVPLLQYGAAIGLPIIGFTLGSYWGDHYRNRPFYRDRGRWEHRPMPHGPVYRPPLPRDHGRPGPGAGPRPPGDPRFLGGSRPGEAGRAADGGRPGFGRGGDPGVRTDRGRPDGGPGRPDGDRGRPDGGRGGPGGGHDRPGGGGRPQGGGQGPSGDRHEGRPGR